MTDQKALILIGKNNNLEVYKDKVALRNKIIDALSDILEYKYLSDISFQSATLFMSGYIKFTQKYSPIINYFYFPISKNKAAFKLFRIIKENHESFIENQKIIEEQEKQKKLQQESERLRRIEDQKLNNPEEFQRKVKLCEDIFREYNSLFKTLKNIDDIYEKVSVLKECYRKLDVIDNTHHANDCFYYVFDEKEKVEKKAISTLNAYIKDECASGSENYEIDIMQFSDDLDFIYCWIYDKDEKLNR